ncbi:MAG: D-2-hydroxyacid dehydrogenase [Oscillospiraceae bacterium]
MKIVLLDWETVTGNPAELAEITAQGEAVLFPETADMDIAAAIGGADAVICNKCHITEDVFARCPNLKFVGLFATGYNNVDTDAATRRGAVVCNVPDYSTDAVAQHTMAFILNRFSRVGEYAANVKAGDWIRCKRFSGFHLPTEELSGKTLGIVGFGNIGRRVAELGNSFGMRVFVWNRTAQRVTEAGYEFLPLTELLARAAIVSLHLPLNPDTKHIINEKTLAVMKPDSLLINTARGGLIDESALAAALKNGTIGGACLDVLKKEPMTADCPLQDAPNCVITPHVAWSPVQTRSRLVRAVAENLRRWAAGHPHNVVNL